jgi:hypothetical protein
MIFLILYFVGLAISWLIFGYANAKSLHDIGGGDWDVEDIAFGIFVGGFIGFFWPVTLPCYGIVKGIQWIANNPERANPIPKLRKLKGAR